MGNFNEVKFNWSIKIFIDSGLNKEFEQYVL